VCHWLLHLHCWHRRLHQRLLAPPAAAFASLPALPLAAARLRSRCALRCSTLRRRRSASAVASSEATPRAADGVDDEDGEAAGEDGGAEDGDAEDGEEEDEEEGAAAVLVDDEEEAGAESGSSTRGKSSSVSVQTRARRGSKATRLAVAAQ
jgi:hypothetical protein